MSVVTAGAMWQIVDTSNSPLFEQFREALCDVNYSDTYKCVGCLMSLLCSNLNFNMLGGDLSQLADLPDIFPNLVHLG